LRYFLSGWKIDCLKLLDKLNCDFVVHGDDMPVTSDGMFGFHNHYCSRQVSI
jgi:hypothetical protein